MKNYFVLLFLVVIGACQKAPLDVQPVFDIPEEKAIRNVNDLEVLINGAYQSLQARNAYGAALKLVPDLVSDQVVITPRAFERNTGDFFNVYTRQFFGTGDGIWREAYNSINRANAVIAAINSNQIANPSDNDKAIMNRIKGEAYFLRGMMHFELVRLWSQQYGINQDEPQSGVLLKLSPTRGRYEQPRATTREVYQAVESDLNQAIQLLPESPSSTDLRTYTGRVGGRAVKIAAQAVLARVLFQKATAEDDEKARVLMDEVLANPNHSIQQDIFSENAIDFLVKNGYNISPSVYFQVVNIINPFTNEGTSTVKPLLDSYFPEVEGESSGAQFPTIYMLSSLFTDSVVARTNSADQRIASGTQGTNPRYTTKYKSPGQSLDLNVPIIRAGELVISRAEILATQGKKEEAINDIISLRRRAFKVFGPAEELQQKTALQALSPSGLLREIARERSRELFTEGDRLHHFRRFAQRHKLPGTLAMGTARSSYRLENFLIYNDARFLFQIPDAEIAANPVVKRN